MSVFVDDLHGHTVEIGADEEFETASTIKAYILKPLLSTNNRGKASLERKNHLQARALCGRFRYAPGAGRGRKSES